MQVSSDCDYSSRTPNLSNFFLVLGIYSVLLFYSSPPDRVLNWDAVDYLNASLQGIYNNALDVTAFSPSYLINLVLSKLQGLAVPEIPGSYSEILDVVHLRHYHPPLLQYLGTFLAIGKHLGLSPSSLALGDFVLRWLCGALYITSIFLSTSRIYRFGNHKTLCVLYCFIVVYSALLLTFVLQSHVLIALSLFLVAFSLSKIVFDTTVRSSLLFSATIALMILSLETSLLVIPLVFIIYCFYHRVANLKFGNGRSFRYTLLSSILYVILIPFLFVFLLWPGSLIKFSLIRTYAVLIYRIFFVSTEYDAVFSFSNLYHQISAVFPLFLGAFFVVILVVQSIFSEINLRCLISPDFYLGMSSRFYLSLSMLLIGTYYAILTMPFLLRPDYIAPGLSLVAILLPSTLYSCITRKAISLSSFRLFVFPFLIFGAPFAMINIANNHISSLAQYPGHNSIHSIRSFLQTNSDAVKSPTIYADGAHVFRFYLPEFSSSFLDIGNVSRPLDDKTSSRILIRSNLQWSSISEHLDGNPSLIVLRDRYKDIVENLDFNCEPTPLPGLVGGFACSPNTPSTKD